jgi:hypothetical protein
MPVFRVSCISGLFVEGIWCFVHQNTHAHTRARALWSAQIAHLSERFDGNRGKALFVPSTKFLLRHFINWVYYYFHLCTLHTMYVKIKQIYFDIDLVSRMMCNAACFVTALAMNCKVYCRPVLVWNCLELTLQEDVTLDEADPELSALDSKWAWLREGVNFLGFFFSAHNKLLDLEMYSYL